MLCVSILDANLETISVSYSAPVRAILKYVQTKAHVEEGLLWSRFYCVWVYEV